MCEFCIQHGEGKKWYLQAKNYSKELNNWRRVRYWFSFANNIEGWITNWATELDRLVANDPSSKQEFISRRAEEFKREHYGQVVPLEEICQIIDMTIGIVRFPCVCRSALLGRYDARYCYGISTYLSTQADLVGLYPDFSRDLEVLTQEEAKKAFRDHDRNGLVHTVWTLGSPFIGVLCNCTYRECFPITWRLRGGVPMFFKAEYAADIAQDTCNGCRRCMEVCNFGAIDYSVALEKCSVAPLRCYGCGVCRAACPNDAITLSDRNAIPILAKDW